MFKFLIFFIYIGISSVVAIEISSKIDLDKEDASFGFDSSSDKTDAVVIVIKNSNTDIRKLNRDFQTSSASRPRARDNVSIRGPVKPIRPHDNYPPNLQPTRPKVVKNICIVINGKGITKLDNFECREGICETTLSTGTDDMGNAIESVHLTIVTKAEEPEQVEDIPVVDGVRGTQYENRNPTFATPHPLFLDNNIPQASVYRPNQVPRRYPSRPQSASFYPRNYGSRKTSPAWNPWVPSTGSIDDKIEPPLSRTITSDE